MDNINSSEILNPLLEKYKKNILIRVSHVLENILVRKLLIILFQEVYQYVDILLQVLIYSISLKATFI